MTHPEAASSPPLLAVVIPTHNRRASLLRTLEAVARFEGVRFRAVVVCDGCTDGTQAAVRERFPETLLVEGDGNLWWSGAINAGIRAVQQLGARCFLLLNDDVVPDPGLPAALLAAAARHPDALIGSIVYFMERPAMIWCAGGRVDWRGPGASMRGNERPDGPEWQLLAPVDWLPGMGTLIPASVLERIGMLDAETFPQYFGDTDFGLRARRAGIPLWVCPEARLYNDVATTGALLPAGPVSWKSASTLLCSRRSHAHWRTRWRFWRRHCPPLFLPWQVLRFYGPLCLGLARRLVWYAFTCAAARRPGARPAP